MRAAIKCLPDRTLIHETYLDNDGIDTDRRRIRASVSIKEDEVLVDYTGTAPQAKGPVNVTWVMANCFAFQGVKSALDPKGAINSGSFRPIKVIAPERTMLNAKPPAASGGYCEIGHAAILVMGALGQLVPHNISADEPSSANHQNLAGVDIRPDDPHRFIYYDGFPPGNGARADKDGLDYARTIRTGNVNIQSMEVVEHRYPLTFLKNELRQDSGGPGKSRGGLGALREYHTPSDGSVSFLGDQTFVPPSGMFEGKSGAAARFEFIRNGKTIPVSPTYGGKITAAPTYAGDVIRYATGGGGGFGDPLERDPTKVKNDVLDGKVSIENARRSYGIVFGRDDLNVDIGATEQERAKLARERIYLTTRKSDKAPIFVEGMRIAFVDCSLKQKGFNEGDLTEICSPRHHIPLRVHFRFDANLPENSILIDPEAWETLELEPEDPVLWRKAH